MECSVEFTMPLSRTIDYLSSSVFLLGIVPPLGRPANNKTFLECCFSLCATYKAAALFQTRPWLPDWLVRAFRQTVPYRWNTTKVNGPIQFAIYCHHVMVSPASLRHLGGRLSGENPWRSRYCGCLSAAAYSMYLGRPYLRPSTSVGGHSFIRKLRTYWVACSPDLSLNRHIAVERCHASN